MPNCPDYLSGPSSSRRLTLNERLTAKEQSNVSNALNQSRYDCEQQEKYDLCQTLEDVKHRLQIEKPWQLFEIDSTNNFTIAILQQSSDGGTSAEKCLTIDENLMLSWYMSSVELPSLDKF